jgi:hypothetical protein
MQILTKKKVKSLVNSPQQEARREVKVWQIPSEERQKLKKKKG